MAIKPLERPKWADDETQVSTPPGAKQDSGWDPGEKPPATWMNWFQLWTYRWLIYFEELTDGLAQASGALAVQFAILVGRVRRLERSNDKNTVKHNADWFRATIF